MRKATACISCFLALLLAACAGQDLVVSRLEGSEPQRLSFGAPASVQDAFTKQMQSCWFEGSPALLSGYQYNTKPGALETAKGLIELRQITIQSGPESDAERFLIQFYPFNNNTLISTRNLSFPVNLAARMKQDVEVWVFGRKDCNPPGAPSSTALAPQTGSSSTQLVPPGGWATDQEPRYPSQSRY